MSSYLERDFAAAVYLSESPTQTGPLPLYSLYSVYVHVLIHRGKRRGVVLNQREGRGATGESTDHKDESKIPTLLKVRKTFINSVVELEQMPLITFWSNV